MNFDVASWNECNIFYNTFSSILAKPIITSLETSSIPFYRFLPLPNIDNSLTCNLNEMRFS